MSGVVRLPCTWMKTGRPTAFEAYYPEPLDTWYEVQAWPDPDGLSVYFLDISARRAVTEQTERAARRAHLLAEVTSELTGTLDATRVSPDILWKG